MRTKHQRETGTIPETTPVREAANVHLDYVLTRLLRFLAVFGFIAYVPSVWGAVNARLWAIAVVDTIAYGVIVYAAVSRDLPMRVKNGILVGSGLVVGTVVLFGVGMDGAGYIWLMAAVFFSAAFGSTRMIVASVVSVGVILGVYVVFAALGRAVSGTSAIVVGIVMSNLVLVSIAVAYTIHVLLARLRRLAETQERLSRQLKAELDDNIAVRRSLDHTLQSKRALLRELDHRVRNNLQIVLSLVNMAADDAPRFDELRSRVEAISVVHHQLDPTGDATGVDIGDVLSHVVANVRAGFDRDGLVWRFAQPENGVIVGVDAATNIAVAATEIVTNSARHAEGGSVEISIDVGRDADSVVIEFSDTGRTAERDTDGTRRRGTGTALIEGLIEQAGATVEITQSGGTRYLVRLPVAAVRTAR